jgi:hypothetical protein
MFRLIDMWGGIEMIGQTVGAVRKVLQPEQQFTIAGQKDVEASNIVEENGDAMEETRTRTGWLVLSLLVWGGLILAIAGAENGGALFSSEFWLSSKGVGILGEIVLPTIFVLLLQAIAGRLRDVSRQNDEIRTAIARLAEPESATSGKIVSIRHVVHKELASLNEHLDRSLNKTSEIEAVIKREVGTLETSFAENERRMLGLVQELARQRETVTIATEQVRDVVRTNREALNGEFAALAAQMLEAGNYARGVVEEVGFELKGELASQSSDFAESLRRMVDDKIQPISEMLAGQVQSIDALLSNGGGGLISTFETQGQSLISNLDATWNRIGGDLANQSRLADEMAVRLTGVVDQSLESSVNRLESRIRSASLEILGVLDNGAEQAAQKIVAVAANSIDTLDVRIESLHSGLDAQVGRFSHLAESTAERLIPALERHNDKLERAIELEQAFDQTTTRLSGVLTEQAAIFVDALSRNAAEFQAKLSDQTNVMSDGLAGKLDRVVGTLEDGSKRFESTLQNVQDTISLASDKLTIAVAEHNVEFAQRVNQIETLVADGSERIDEHLSRGVADLSVALDAGSHTVDAIMGSRTEHIREALAEALSGADTAFAAGLAEFDGVQTGHQEKLRSVLEAATGSIADLIESGRGMLASASDKTRQEMVDATARFGGAVRDLQARFSSDLEAFSVAARTSLADTGADSVSLLDTRMAEITAVLQDRVNGIYNSLDARTREFEANITQFGSNIDTQTTRLHRVIGQRSEAIEQGIQQGVGRFDEAMSTHLERTNGVIEHFLKEESETFRRQLDTLTQALDDQSEGLERRLAAISAAIGSHGKEFESRIVEFASAIESQAGRLHKTITLKSQSLEQNVEQGVDAIRDMLSTHLKQTQNLTEQFVEEETSNFDRQIDVFARTLDGRAEILDSIIRTRGADFTDQLYSSAREFEEQLTSTSRTIENTVRAGGAELQEQLTGRTAEMQIALDIGLRRALSTANAHIDDVNARLSSATNELGDLLDRKSGALAKSVSESAGALERVLDVGAGKIDTMLTLESQHLADALAGNVVALGNTIEARAGEMISNLRAQAGAVVTALDESSDKVAQAVEGAARDLDKTTRDSVSGAKATFEKSTEVVTRLLNSSVEATQQQVSSNVESLLSRLAAHERTATSRMENAAANVGENTRKAAELTAERLVTLNGALVQVLSSLGTARPTTRKAKPEALPDAAE